MKSYIFPGQGSQQKGMGGELFDEFPQITSQADEILGYSIKTLCLEDPNKQLAQTQFTQPALYTVNALTYLKRQKEPDGIPDYLAGHSLGEYNALFASGGFDFGTGLRLVKKRGELMRFAGGGGMAAVIGVGAEKVKEILIENNIDSIDIANFNTPTQTVIAGMKDDIVRAVAFCEHSGAMCIPLNVSGAFHSRYMKPSAEEYEAFVNGFRFSELIIPVISNVTARPYKQADIKENLVEQMTSPVKWTQSIRYLMGKKGMEFEEIGPGNVLKKLEQRIRKEAAPLIIEAEEEAEKLRNAVPERDVLEEHGALAKGNTQNSFEVTRSPVGTPYIVKQERNASVGEISPLLLGCPQFRKDYKLTYAYLAGSMYRGISSKNMVVKLGKAGIMGFFGAGGLSIAELEEAIDSIQKELSENQPYGVNLMHNLFNPEREEQKVDLFLKYGVKVVEASAYISITPALIRYRAGGLMEDRSGAVSSTNRIIAKVSRPEVAELFMRPVPERLIDKLVREGKVSEQQAGLLAGIPMADDICVEADSGGHTDAGVAYVLMPAMLKLRDEMMRKYNYSKKIRVGAAGGIGAPAAAAAAFTLGADFILCGSINQCTVEASTSDTVKDLLQQMNVQDTDYAPAGDMFEVGAKVQVLKKGLFFPARANKLYELYRQYNSLEEIDEKSKTQLQEKYFKCSFDKIYEDIKASSPANEIEKADRNPKYKMGLIFKRYFSNSSKMALKGGEESKVDYQIFCGPALGAFNQWIKGTELENWRNRHVDKIGIKLMTETAEFLNHRFQVMSEKTF